MNILKKCNIKNIEELHFYKINSKNKKYDKMIEKIYDINELFILYNSDKLNKNSYPSELLLDDKNTLSTYGIHFDKYEYELYDKIYKNLNRNPKFIEIYDLCQIDSEHSRHWFFRGKLLQYSL